MEVTHKLSKAMKDSVEQQGFFGKHSMHYMASLTEVCNNLFLLKEIHYEHVYLYECMGHPISFHAEMMGMIM
jgi:hypothetical protein